MKIPGVERAAETICERLNGDEFVVYGFQIKDVACDIIEHTRADLTLELCDWVLDNCGSKSQRINETACCTCPGCELARHIQAALKGGGGTEWIADDVQSLVQEACKPLVEAVLAGVDDLASCYTIPSQPRWFQIVAEARKLKGEPNAK